VGGLPSQHFGKASRTASTLLAPVSPKSDPITPGLQHEVETVAVQALAANGAPLRVKDSDKHTALFAPRTPASEDVRRAAHQNDATD
jgi:hypothetical protein